MPLDGQTSNNRTEETSIEELDIDQTRFVDTAFGRNQFDYKIIGPDHAYLDCDSGEIFWIYRDEEKAKNHHYRTKKRKMDSLRREMIKVHPNHYLEIPGKTMEEHNKILVEFLNSE